jgi:hypothetical protein
MGKSHGSPVGHPASPFVFARANYGNARLLTKFVRLAAYFFCLGKYFISYLTKIVWGAEHKPAITVLSDSFYYSL